MQKMATAVSKCHASAGTDAFVQPQALCAVLVELGSAATDTHCQRLVGVQRDGRIDGVRLGQVRRTPTECRERDQARPIDVVVMSPVTSVRIGTM